MDEKEIIERVDRYLERMRTDPNVEKYDLREEGTWRIIGPARADDGHREPLRDAVKGQFTDAVAYAIQREEFYAGDWSRNNHDPFNAQNGRIQKVPVYKLKKEGLGEVE